MKTKMTKKQVEKMVCDHYGLWDIRGLQSMCITDETYTTIESEVVETIANEGFTYDEAQKMWLSWMC